MSDKISYEPLDNMLRQWADERAASSEHLDNLQDRILSAIREKSPAVEPPAAGWKPTASVTSPTKPLAYQRRPVSLRRASLVGRLIGAILLALVAFIWSAQSIDVGGRRLQIADATQPKFPDYAQLDDGQLDERLIVLSEMQGVFGDQLNWLAETDSRFEVGLSEREDASDPSTSEHAAVPLAMRVVVEKRAAAGHDWELAWTVDVMSKSEEVIDLAPATYCGTSMRLWAYAMPDGMFAVDSELAFSNGDPSGAPGPAARGEIFRAAFSNIQHDRLPSEELLIGSDGVEYRVLQTVAILHKKVG